MKIKVCGMKDSGNIEALSAMLPDYIGFIFYDRSPRFAGAVDPASLPALPENIRRVGVFVNAEKDHITEIARAYGLHLIQLHGDESPEFCRSLRGTYGIIKAFGIAGEEDIHKSAAYEGSCDYFLFDTAAPLRGGSGRKFDHSLLAAYNGSTPYFISGGISLQDAGYLAGADLPLCHAVDINSRFETEPGMKDVSAVNNFIKTIRSKHRIP